MNRITIELETNFSRFTIKGGNTNNDKLYFVSSRVQATLNIFSMVKKSPQAVFFLFKAFL